jgi:hypothetical protein
VAAAASKNFFISESPFEEKSLNVVMLWTRILPNPLRFVEPWIADEVAHFVYE